MDTYTKPFYCSSEWHLARLKGTGASVAPLVYSFALTLSRKSGVFNVASGTIGTYLDVDPTTVRKAYRLLVQIGFFEVVYREHGTSVAYRVLRHSEWQEKYAGQCCERDAAPWENEDGQDTLGPRLYGLSGGRYRTYPDLLKGIRNVGFTEEETCALFREFVLKTKPVGRQWRDGFTGELIKFLKVRKAEEVTGASGSQRPEGCGSYDPEGCGS